MDQDQVDQGHAATQATPRPSGVRTEPAHWRYSVATFLAGANAVAVLFLTMFAQNFEDQVCRRADGRCTIVPSIQVTVGVIALFAVLAFYANWRWARRPYEPIFGLILAGWVLTLGPVAVMVQPFEASDATAFLAGVWGTAGMAIAWITAKVSIPKLGYFVDVIAVVLWVALVWATWDAALELPDWIRGRRGD